MKTPRIPQLEPTHYWVRFERGKGDTIECLSPEVYERGWTMAPFGNLFDIPMSARFERHASGVWRLKDWMAGVPHDFAQPKLGYCWGGPRHGRTHIVGYEPPEGYMQTDRRFDLLPTTNGERDGIVFVPATWQIHWVATVVTDEMLATHVDPDSVVDRIWARNIKLLWDRCPDCCMTTCEVEYEAERNQWRLSVVALGPRAPIKPEPPRILTHA